MRVLLTSGLWFREYENVICSSDYETNELTDDLREANDKIITARGKIITKISTKKKKNEEKSTPSKMNFDSNDFVSENTYENTRCIYRDEILSNYLYALLT